MSVKQSCQIPECLSSGISPHPELHCKYKKCGCKNSNPFCSRAIESPHVLSDGNDMRASMWLQSVSMFTVNDL